MGARTIMIRRLARTPYEGPEDELAFSPGVNVISGGPNTGKSKWLLMLDYLLGDPGKPEDAFGEELADKYDSIRAVIDIDGEETTLERRWKETGQKTKVFVNDEPIADSELSHLLLKRLDIPDLRYPKGNPYAERTWPELSWRTLLRHVYRRQKMWHDIADKQPESEQYAVLILFLGIAEHLFSAEQGQLVEKRKEVYRLEGRKAQFLELLDQVSREIVKEKDLQVALTEDSVDGAISRLNQEIAQRQEDRERILDSLLTDVAAEYEAEERSRLERLRQEWVRLQSDRALTSERIALAEDRLKEIGSYRTSLAAELSKMRRATAAGHILAGLKVTHCPVCDQPVHQTLGEGTHCFLCHQSLPVPSSNGKAAEQRVAFEIEQLEEELREAEDLLKSLQSEHRALSADDRDVRMKISQLETTLRPVRQAAAMILPPEIAVIDTETGQLQERIAQLERTKELLKLQHKLSADIDALEHQIASLESAVAAQAEQINLQQASEDLQSGINTYLNAIKAENQLAWKVEGGVQVKLSERAFAFNIGGTKWANKLGGTFVLYFLLAYHYGLLNLSSREQYHFPGLVILDFPATLDDGTSTVDKESRLGCHLVLTSSAEC